MFKVACLHEVVEEQQKVSQGLYVLGLGNKLVDDLHHDERQVRMLLQNLGHVLLVWKCRNIKQRQGQQLEPRAVAVLPADQLPHISDQAAYVLQPFA